MRAIYGGFLILAVLVGLFIGYYIWGPTWRLPCEFKYDVLKDTLTIVLAVLAVGIGVIGYAVYQILSGRLQVESESASKQEVLKGCARLFGHLGWVFWNKYNEAKRKELQYLDVAITLTEQGLSYFNQLPEKEQKKRENDILLCITKNNLAYYYAGRQGVKDKDTAKEYAEFIRNKISNYPEQKEFWLDTYTFVSKQYPD